MVNRVSILRTYESIYIPVGYIHRVLFRSDIFQKIVAEIHNLEVENQNVKTVIIYHCSLRHGTVKDCPDTRLYTSSPLSCLLLNWCLSRGGKERILL